MNKQVAAVRWAWAAYGRSLSAKIVLNLYAAVRVGFAFYALGQVGLLNIIWIPLAATCRYKFAKGRYS